MRKINKLALFLAVILLYQNMSFCIPEASFALRPPLVTNKTDFVVWKELKINIDSDLEEPEQHVIDFLGKDYDFLLLDSVSVIPDILYKDVILESSVHSRSDLLWDVIDKLRGNLRDHSDRNGSEICIQIGYYEKNRKAIRIVSRNRESIKGLTDILDGAKIRRDERREGLAYRGLGLIFLKEFAFNNQGIVFIIDTNGDRISVSEDSIIPSRGMYPGTEVQMIISIPFQLEGFFTIEGTQDILVIQYKM